MITARFKMGIKVLLVTCFLFLVSKDTYAQKVDIIKECPVPFSSSTELPFNEKCDCTSDWIGSYCRICSSDDSCEAAFGGPEHDPEGLYDNHRCGRDFILSQEQPVFQSWCEVDNAAIEDQVNGLSFIDLSYDATSDTGRIDFVRFDDDSKYPWSKVFTCTGSQCTISVHEDQNQVQYACEEVACALTCSIGATPECTNFLGLTVNGIGGKGFTYTCNKEANSCELKESTLNLFFSDVIGTNCQVGSCTKSIAVKPNATAINAIADADVNILIGNLTNQTNVALSFQITAYSLSGGILTLILIIFTSTLMFMISMKKFINTGNSKELTHSKELQEFDNTKKKTLTFDQINYQLKDGKRILSNVSGIAKHGEITAIMGPSGAGKTTLMDILAMRQMGGKMTGGAICVNDKPINTKLKKEIGYVDQGDNLVSTLTVFENLLFSALLRLPQDMSMSQKIEKVRTVMKTLQLSHAENTRIGGSGSRGVSGGEKRRVSVGMELVNNPTILFLDEPTSGLDSYNASVLVNCLHQLAWKTGTAVITSIHQPRTNIFNKFDRLLVLHHGESVYCGPVTSLSPYLANIGSPVPSDYNPADYIIDTLFNENDVTNIDESVDPESEHAGKQNMSHPNANPFCAESFIASDLYEALKKDIEGIRVAYDDSSKGNGEMANDAGGLRLWLHEVCILSSRNMIGLFRNPLLFAFHLGFSVYFALLLGVIYFNLDMVDLASIQNRLGAFMLMAVFVSFTSLSALSLFWSERSLYIHERSNRFYSPSAYFVSKVFFDIVPLRVIPALVLGLVAYGMLGLRSGSTHLLDFLISLILISCTAASINLILGILIQNIMTGIFTGIIVMIHYFIMTKLFINFDSVSIRFVKILNYVSYFNYGYEAMVQNELVGRRIEEFAVDNGNGILTFLGFNIDTLHRNIVVLICYFLGSLTIAFISLKYGVKEHK